MCDNDDYRNVLIKYFFVTQEHHLQRAICTGLIIPTPEVTDLADAEAYNKIYPADYKLPRQLIHMQRKRIKMSFLFFIYIIF